MCVFVDDHLALIAFFTLGLLLRLLLCLLDEHVPVEQLELLFGCLSLFFSLAFLGLSL